MTLGCGGYGGNITSDNISPRHLLNIKRLAYEIDAGGRRRVRRRRTGAEPGALPKAPAPPKTVRGVGAAVAGLADRRVPGLARLHAPAPNDRQPAHRPALGRRLRRLPAPAPATPASRRAASRRAGREADRLRVRRRRAAGHAAGAHDSHWREDDRHAGGARSRRGAQDLRSRLGGRADNAASC